MTSRGSPVLRLGGLELATLEHLWSVEDADVNEVHAEVGRQRDITLNTVGSTLERLHKKGLVTRTKVSHAFRYRAALQRQEFQARKVVDAIGGLDALRERGTLAAFVDLVAASGRKALLDLERLVRAKRGSR